MPHTPSVFTTVTACTMDCPDTCSLLVSVDGNGAIRIRGNPDHPYTAGFTCAKIRRHGERLRHPDRILTPLLRNGAKWNPISWERALDLCAEQISRFRTEPLSILHIHGAGARGVINGATQLFFTKLGATGIRGSLCDSAGITAGIHDFGSRKNNDPADILNARYIVNWGRDLSRSSAHTAALVQKARKAGATVVTISPGGDGNRTYSDRLLRIRPGTDRLLAAAVIRRFIDAGEIPPAIRDRTKNWPAFRASIADLDPAGLPRSCDTDPETVRFLHGIYRSADPTATIVGAGLQRYGRGGENVRFINALALISGNMGIRGGGAYFHLDSSTHLNMGWLTESAQGRRRTLLTPALGREILSADDPPIEMIWVNGCNIVNQAPAFEETAKAFDRTGFVVVVDAFMTDTAMLADLVLPCALMLEQENMLTAFGHDWIQYAPQVLPPPPGILTDYQILQAVGRRLEPPIELPGSDDLMASALDSPAIDIDLAALREKGFHKIPTPAVAYENLRFDHPDGLARLPEALHMEPLPPEGYPMRLLSLIRGDVIHSQMTPREQQTPPRVWVAPDAPHLQALDLTAETFLVSAQGRLRVRVETLEGLHPGTIVYRRGDWALRGGGVNRLVAAGETDVGEGAPFYDTYVRLENATA